MRSVSRSLLIATAIAGLSSPAASKGMPTVSALSGEWRIYKTAFVEPGGVQAYSTDQLNALVGTRLSVNRKAVKWNLSRWRAMLREHKDSFADRCPNPAIQNGHPGRFRVKCGDGSVFGPDGDEPDFAVLGNGNLKIEWYDNIVLYLRKQK